MNENKQIPTLDITEDNFKEKLNYLLWSTHSSSDYSNERARPYNGQFYTDFGERGKTIVDGLTMRDIVDCFVKVLLIANPESDKDIFDHAMDTPNRKKLLSEKVDNNTWRVQDIYEVNMADIAPLAIAQNLTCEIEKMMGIFPNTVPLTSDDIKKELSIDE